MVSMFLARVATRSLRPLLTLVSHDHLSEVDSRQYHKNLPIVVLK